MSQGRVRVAALHWQEPVLDTNEDEEEEEEEEMEEEEWYDEEMEEEVENLRMQMRPPEILDICLPGRFHLLYRL